MSWPHMIIIAADHPLTRILRLHPALKNLRKVKALVPAKSGYLPNKHMTHLF